MGCESVRNFVTSHINQFTRAESIEVVSGGVFYSLWRDRDLFSTFYDDRSALFSDSDNIVWMDLGWQVVTEAMLHEKWRRMGNGG